MRVCVCIYLYISITFVGIMYVMYMAVCLCVAWMLVPKEKGLLCSALSFHWLSLKPYSI